MDVVRGDKVVIEWDYPDGTQANGFVVCTFVQGKTTPSFIEQVGNVRSAIIGQSNVGLFEMAVKAINTADRSMDSDIGNRVPVSVAPAGTVPPVVPPNPGTKLAPPTNTRVRKA